MKGLILEDLWGKLGNLYLFCKQMRDFKEKFKFVFWGRLGWVQYR